MMWFHGFQPQKNLLLKALRMITVYRQSLSKMVMFADIFAHCTSLLNCRTKVRKFYIKGVNFPVLNRTVITV